MIAKREHAPEAQPIELYSLPATWQWGTVSNVGADQKNAIVDGPFGSNLKLSDYVADGTVPVLTTKNLEGTYNDLRYISQKKFEELKRSAVYPGDILMAKIGSCGKTGIYSFKAAPAMIPANLLKVSVCQKFDRKYVYYYFNSPFFQKALKTIIKATAQPAFGVTNFRKLPLPIAPLPVQHEIIAEIEKQFSRLDEAVASLKRIKATLKRYKASVLKAAVEGKLTAEWRKNNKDVEPAEKLLKRILAERKKKWEEKNQGKKYKEPSAPDTSNLPELPKGWVWANGDQLASKIVDGTHHTPTYVTNGIPFISVKDVFNGKIHFDDCKYITVEEHKRLKERCHPEKGDVVITKSGTIGRTSVIDTDKEFSLFVSVALLKPASKLIIPNYLKLILDAYIQSINIQQTVKGGVIKNLHLEDLRVVPLRVAPFKEQQKIVEEIESRLSVAEEIETAVETSLKRAERLRQAILKKAFSGQLSVRLS